MTKKTFELINYFFNENVIVTELKLSSENDGKILWVKINSATREVEELTFLSSKSERVNDNDIFVRIFENAELRSDKFFAKFQHNQEGQILMVSELEQVPQIVLDKIEEYLTSKH